MNGAFPELASTGIAGLDKLLKGGLPRGAIYSVEGDAGTGKTILALHFLSRGIEQGEKCLFITLSQSISCIKRAAGSLGLTTQGMVFHELSHCDQKHQLEQRQVVFDRRELEVDELMQSILDVVKQEQPSLVVFDAISHLRILDKDDYTYRLQLLMLREHFYASGATVLLTNNQQVAEGHSELPDLVDGILSLQRQSDRFGAERRLLEITKIRGHGYQSGLHDMTIDEAGIQVHPRGYTPGEPMRHPQLTISSGDANVDRLLGGGLRTGSSCLLLGPSGTGKTTTATLFICQSALHHGGALVYLFDELPHIFLSRSEALGMPVQQLLEQGTLIIRHIPTASLSPGAFSHQIARDLQATGARAVLIDSLTGYLNALGDPRLLETHIHDLLMDLSTQNVLSLLVVAQHGLLGNNLRDPVDISYLADTVLLLRYFELKGQLRRALSVFKKRDGRHENCIRELIFDRGISAGESLDNFEGILSGSPRFLHHGTPVFDGPPVSERDDAQ